MKNKYLIQLKMEQVSKPAPTKSLHLEKKENNDDINACTSMINPKKQEKQ